VAGRQRSTIVVVEESAAVQELVEQALRETGDCVLVTQNPLEVIEVARRVRIDLLVTDLHAGDELVEQLRSSQPDIRILYLSDTTDGPPPGPDDSTPLRMPFSLDELREAIAARLDRAESFG
jgi:DNA-binding response OmpR family regulator